MKGEKELKIPVKEKLSYAIGAAGGNITQTVLGSFLTAYYTDTAGIAAAAVATMMLLSRVLDGATDLVAGGLIDRTSTKKGKARPWIIAMAPMVAIAFILLMNVPQSFGEQGRIFYMYLTYIFMNCIVYTMYGIAHSALLARLSLDMGERLSATALGQIFTSIITVAITYLVTNGVRTLGWHKLSIILAVAAMVCILIEGFGTREHVDEGVDAANAKEGSGKKKQTTPLKKAIPALLKNKYFYLVTLMQCVILIANANSGASTYYYCNIVLGNLGIMTVLTLITQAAQLAVNFAMPGIVGKIGKQKCVIVGAVCAIIGFFMMGAIGTNMAGLITGNLLKGVGFGFFSTAVMAYAADVVDYGEWRFGIRSEGLVNSCTTVGIKIGIGLGSALFGAILSSCGYMGPEAVPTAAVISGIKFAFGYVGAILSVILLVLALFMDVEKYRDVMMEDLMKKRERA